MNIPTEHPHGGPDPVDAVVKTLIEDVPSAAPPELRRRVQQVGRDVRVAGDRTRRARTPMRRRLVVMGSACAVLAAAGGTAAILGSGSGPAGRSSSVNLPLVAGTASAAEVTEAAADAARAGAPLPPTTVRVLAGAAMLAPNTTAGYRIRGDGMLEAVLLGADGAVLDRDTARCSQTAAPTATCVDAIDDELRTALAAQAEAAAKDLPGWIAREATSSMGVPQRAPDGVPGSEAVGEDTPLEEAMQRYTVVGSPVGGGKVGGVRQGGLVTPESPHTIAVRILQLPDVDQGVRAAAWQLLGAASGVLERVAPPTTYGGLKSVALEGLDRDVIGASATTLAKPRRLRMTAAALDAATRDLYEPHMNRMCPDGTGEIATYDQGYTPSDREGLEMSGLGPVATAASIQPGAPLSPPVAVCQKERTVRIHLDPTAARIIGVEEFEADGTPARGPSTTEVTISITDPA